MTTGFVETLTHITLTLTVSHISTLLESGGGRLSRRHTLVPEITFLVYWLQLFQEHTADGWRPE